jgi:hypothetical protein
MLGASVHKMFQWLSSMADPKRLATFRNTTIFVIIIWVLNLWFFISEMREPANPALADYYKRACSRVHSPLPFFSYFVLVALGFWAIRRYRIRHPFVCVAIYGMLLAGLLGLINGWVLCRFFGLD